MATILKLWQHEEIRLSQSIHIYLKNNRAKFLPDLTWNNEALGFFEEIAPNKKKNCKKKKNKIRSVPDPQTVLAKINVSKNVTMRDIFQNKILHYILSHRHSKLPTQDIMYVF